MAWVSVFLTGLVIGGVVVAALMLLLGHKFGRWMSEVRWPRFKKRALGSRWLYFGVPAGLTLVSWAMLYWFFEAANLSLFDPASLFATGANAPSPLEQARNAILLVGAIAAIPVGLLTISNGIRRTNVMRDQERAQQRTSSAAEKALAHSEVGRIGELVFEGTKGLNSESRPEKAAALVMLESVCDSGSTDAIKQVRNAVISYLEMQSISVQELVLSDERVTFLSDKLQKEKDRNQFFVFFDRREPEVLNVESILQWREIYNNWPQEVRRISAEVSREYPATWSVKSALSVLVTAELNLDGADDIEPNSVATFANLYLSGLTLSITLQRDVRFIGIVIGSLDIEIINNKLLLTHSIIQSKAIIRLENSVCRVEANQLSHLQIEVQGSGVLELVELDLRELSILGDLKKFTLKSEGSKVAVLDLTRARSYTADLLENTDIKVDQIKRPEWDLGSFFDDEEFSFFKGPLTQ